MNPYSAQILSYFDALTMDSDRGGVHDYKSLLRSTVSAFLDRPDKERAFEVYSMFFDCYRVKLQGSASFIDLLDTLNSLRYWAWIPDPPVARGGYEYVLWIQTGGESVGFQFTSRSILVRGIWYQVRGPQLGRLAELVEK